MIPPRARRRTRISDFGWANAPGWIACTAPPSNDPAHLRTKLRCREVKPSRPCVSERKYFTVRTCPDNVRMLFSGPEDDAMSETVEARSERVDLRMTPAAKRTLQQAAAVANNTVSEFLLDSS